MGLLRSTFLAQQTHQIEFLFCILKEVFVRAELRFSEYFTECHK